MEYEEMENKIRLHVADVIINLNLVEFEIKEIIGKYIDSEKKEFIENILLNNLILSFSIKVNILKYIIKKENIEVGKDFQNSLKVIMNKRNILAHSDSILNIEPDVIDIDVDWNHDECFLVPIYGGAIEPHLCTIEDGKINYQNITKIAEDFLKHYEIAKHGLLIIRSRIFSQEAVLTQSIDDELPF